MSLAALKFQSLFFFLSICSQRIFFLLQILTARVQSQEQRINEIREKAKILMQYCTDKGKEEMHKTVSGKYVTKDKVNLCLDFTIL